MLGAVVLASGVVSHVAADGRLTHPGLLAGLLAVSVALAALLLGAPASPVRLVALLVGGQTLTHLVLSAGGGHDDGHHPAPGAAELVGHALEQGPLMLVAHAWGAVALGLWLALGESALWHLVAIAAAAVTMTVLACHARSLSLAARCGVHDVSERLTAPVPVPLSLPDTLPHRLITRRGPPVPLAV